MRWQKNRQFLLLYVVTPLLAMATPPDVKTIISRSVQANHVDFAAAPHFNHKEEDDFGNGSKTYQVTMIDGSPYRRLIAVDGKPLSPEDAQMEMQKEAYARRERRAESPAARSARMAKYERGRLRDSSMMSQLTEAFNFTFDGEDTVRGFRVYVLNAKPKPDYQPPNRDCEVLPGMEGKLWIDQKSFQWVQVKAEVIRPVSIAGYLAQVEPGTLFELQKDPVGDGTVWLVSHFRMQASAKVLFLFNKNSQEEDKFWDFQRID
jgi:hypothetical protein